MESSSFAPGKPPPETKHQKKERLRKKQEQKRRETNRRLRQTQEVSSSLLKPSWCILPHHLLHGYEFWIHILKGDTFFTKRQSLLEEIHRMETPSAPVEGFDASRGTTFRNEYLVKAQTVMSFLYQNQMLRWMFKRFITQVRIRRFPPLNEKDPITLDSITEPIQFPSFPQRKYYVFEAKPFAKHLHNKLVHHDGQIPTPLFLKNPFTNEQFTVPQVMSLIEQARRYGHTSWAIESFIASRYNVARFTILHSKLLRLHAFRTTLSKVDDWDSKDTLFEFIKMHHEIHEEPFYNPRYRWAITHAPHAPRIVAWRKLCLKWYETDILIEDPGTKVKFFTEVETRTLPLCDIPNDLKELKFQKQKHTSLESTDGSRSP
jgi:hypothetical protein